MRMVKGSVETLIFGWPASVLASTWISMVWIIRVESAKLASLSSITSLWTALRKMASEVWLDNIVERSPIDLTSLMFTSTLDFSWSSASW